MVTVQQIFDQAIHLIDWQNEETGKTVTVDTDDYRRRTISILNTVIPQLAIYSEDTVKHKFIEHYLRQGDLKDPDFQQAIPLDDDLAVAILPHYLASELEQTENPELAMMLRRTYEDRFADIRGRLHKGKFEAIPLPYGTF